MPLASATLQGARGTLPGSGFRGTGCRSFRGHGTSGKRWQAQRPKACVRTPWVSRSDGLHLQMAGFLRWLQALKLPGTYRDALATLMEAPTCRSAGLLTVGGGLLLTSALPWSCWMWAPSIAGGSSGDTRGKFKCPLLPSPWTRNLDICTPITRPSLALLYCTCSCAHHRIVICRMCHPRAPRMHVVPGGVPGVLPWGWAASHCEGCVWAALGLAQVVSLVVVQAGLLLHVTCAQVAMPSNQ